MSDEQASWSRLPFWRDQLVTALAAVLVLWVLIAKCRGLLQTAFPSMAWFNMLGAALLYLMFFVLFIIRYRAKASMGGFRHWFFVLAGTWLPLMLWMEAQPAPMLFWTGVPIQLAGMGVSILALYTLGRSFGVAAAHREIRTSGLYGVIRHPLYAGEALWLLSLVIQNLSLYNAVLLIVQLGCQIKRLRDEEDLLKRDPQYAAYLDTVRYRLIPGVY